jgi:hypothetical protein
MYLTKNVLKFSLIIIVIINIFNIIFELFFSQTKFLISNQINSYIKQTRLENALFVDVYSLTNTIDGSDVRLAVVAPFNWFLLNFKKSIYISSTSTGNVDACGDGNSSKFVKLNNPKSGKPLNNLQVVCIPFTISTMLEYFSNNKSKQRFTVDVPNDYSIRRLTVIDVINRLLIEGAFSVK